MDEHTEVPESEKAYQCVTLRADGTRYKHPQEKSERCEDGRRVHKLTSMRSGVRELELDVQDDECEDPEFLEAQRWFSRNPQIEFPKVVSYRVRDGEDELSGKIRFYVK